jgi:hypothetical protein
MKVLKWLSNNKITDLLLYNMAISDCLAISKRLVNPVWPTSWQRPLNIIANLLKGVSISLFLFALQNK